jgi:hypothetical protein
MGKLSEVFNVGYNAGKYFAKVVGSFDYSGIDPIGSGDNAASFMYAGGTSGGHTTPNAPVVFSTANQHAMQFYLKSTASQFTGIEMNVYTSKASAGTQWQYPNVAGEFTVRSLGTAAVDNMWAIICQAQILSTYYGPGTGKLMCAGLFKLGVSATANGSAGNGGMGVGIYIDTGLNRASTQGDFGLFIISNNAAGIKLTSAIHIAGGMSYVLDLAEIMTVPNGCAWEMTGAVTNTVDTHASGYLKIRGITAAGAACDRYIQLFDVAL